MADRNKFEQMLELLVNEDKESAEKLFHEIVVEKSRDIYEGLLEDDKDVDEATDEEVDEASDEEVDEATDEEVDEASDEEVDEAKDEEVEENFNLDEFEVEADPADMGGDAADDMMADLGMDDEGGDDEEGDEPEGDVEDRVEDLEDALDDLKAEFEKMMAGDDAGDEEPGDEEPEEEAILPFEASDEEVEEAKDEEVDEASDEEVEEATDEVEETKTPKTAGEEMREYVEKVSAKMGDNGANTKSTVASPNNMGGDASNLVQGAEESGGEHAGLGDMAPKDQDGGNVNVPGGKASKSLKAQPGHGAEKKSKPEDADNKKPVVGG